MKCEIIQDILPLFVDEICGSVTREAVEEHLHTCKECREKEKELRAEFIVEAKDPLEMDKKEILIKREKSVITAVNERILRIVAKFDIVVTSIIILFLFYYSIKSEGLLLGVTKALMSIPFGVPAGGALIVFVIFDGMYLINGKKKKDTFVSGSLVVMSVVAKVMVFFIMLIYLVV